MIGAPGCGVGVGGGNFMDGIISPSRLAMGKEIVKEENTNQEESGDSP